MSPSKLVIATFTPDMALECGAADNLILASSGHLRGCSNVDTATESMGSVIHPFILSSPTIIGH